MTSVVNVAAEAALVGGKIHQQVVDILVKQISSKGKLRKDC